jgi:heme-degrading monooxygenase HmoA
VSDIVKINAIRVPEGMGEVIEQRFAARGDAMNEVDGFVSFELLRPTAGEDRYFVYTRWETEEAFQAWRESQRFAESHAGQTGPPAGHGEGGGHPGGHPGGEGGGPVAMGADLLEFEVALAVTKP